MKIALMNRKHTKSCQEVAVLFDETINDEIISLFNKRLNGSIRLSKVQNEESIFIIQVNRPKAFNGKNVLKDDIKLINETLPEIKAEIEKEEADRKESRKRILETASGNTGLDLDNSEE